MTCGSRRSTVAQIAPRSQPDSLGSRSLTRGSVCRPFSYGAQTRGGGARAELTFVLAEGTAITSESNAITP